MRKGSKEAKAWGAKMKRARKAKNGRKKTRKYTTRKRRTTRKGDLTLKRKPAFKTRRKKSSDDWSW